jgi:sn-glycerol 3-phosphate transport system ATP-binding protein
MANVSLKNIQKVYPNGFQAVHDASLEIADGEFIVLVGPSGCGKSTLLRMVAGLESITNGELHIGSKLVNELDPAERDIAMVFQNYALYPHMSVYNNMAYGLKNRKISAVDIKDAVEKAAKMLDLEPLLERKPSQLSGGQRQRVAMGRAIVRSPALFLFDEPLSNLDAKLRNQMRIEIRKLQKDLGTTSIYVTHDQIEAMTMADRIVVLNGGNIEQIGTPEEIYHKPASTFVASFMGAPPMNLIPGKIGSDQKVLIESVGAIDGDLNFNFQGDVMVGVRPEKMKLTNTPNGITKPFKHELTEELGAARLVHGLVGDKKMIVNLHQEDAIPSGELYVSIKADMLHIFDQQTGERLN